MTSSHLARWSCVPVVFPLFLFSSIYSVFHSSLVDHLFAKQSSSLPRVDVSDIDMATLHGQLEEVERCAAINPIEEELHLGMRGIDIVRLAGGAKEAPAAGPTPKETLLGEARGGIAEERERKTAGYEQPSEAGWKKEGREVGQEKIPSKGQLSQATSSVLDAVARAWTHTLLIIALVFHCFLFRVRRRVCAGGRR